MPGCRVQSPPPRLPGHPSASPGHRAVCRAAGPRDRSLSHWLVIDEPDLTAGPAIGRQDRVVAVAISHPLARRETISVKNLAEQPVARPPAAFPPALWEAFVPANTPPASQ